MYSKEVTAIIMQDWGKGASAEETRKHLTDVFGKAPCLNTIYTHRNGLTAQDLVNELVTQQQRGITKQESANPELALKYRGELIKTLYPQMSINLNKNINETEVKVNVTSDLLKQYESLFEEAALLEHCAPQQIHSTQADK